LVETLELLRTAIRIIRQELKSALFLRKTKG
jgi:hypothetical protein